MNLNAQTKWELCALNALEQAAQFNFLLSMACNHAIQNKHGVDPRKLLKFVRENQARLARDLREMRKLTVQREEQE